MSETVRVELGPAGMRRDYDVVIGHDLLDGAAAHLAPLLKRPRLAIVTDTTVQALHGARLEAAMLRAGVSTAFLPVPPGESSKSFAQLERVCNDLLALELDRGDVVAAFGGGVVGDLAGFAAGVYKRGVDFVQIPTTLLAQVDSAVGGKTAIDTPRGKNLIGVFHQPRLVLADLDVLATLPPRELRAGFAEVVKYGLIQDEPFFAWLERNAARVLALEPEALTRTVARCVELKAAVVGEDEREAGRRALLNLGHTFAHAFEAEAAAGERGAGGPPILLHGEAVALGCAMAFRFSLAQGLCGAGDAARVESLLTFAALPTRMEEMEGGPFSAARLLARMAQDKKAEAGGLTLVLARGIGHAFVARDVDPAALTAFLLAEGARP